MIPVKFFKSFFYLLLLGITFGQDTLTIMSYNTLRFSSNDVSRTQHFEKVINYVKPDIVAFQEIEDQDGIDLLLNEVFNKNSQDYSSGPLSSSRDMENGVIYNNSKLDMVSNKSISTDLRDISGFSFTIKNAAQNVSSFTVFSAHLKASTGSSNENRRWEEAKRLQYYIGQQDKDFRYILAGDLNLYGPNERAYKLLVDSMSVDLDDPVGDWSRDDNSNVLKYTQSTRTDQIGDGGSTGGLDDRFDFILFSDHFTKNDPNLKYLEGSYKVIGNDGNHYNRSIIDGANNSAPAEIIQSIYYASDHYPVIAKIVYTSKTTTSPIAHAGEDQNAQIGETIILDGSKSYDPNGSIVSYQWKQLSGPNITLENPNSASASFTVPQVDISTTISFKLTIFDNDGETGSDQVNIMIPITSGFTPYLIQLASDKGLGDDCFPSKFAGQKLDVMGVITAIRPDEQYPNFFIQDPSRLEWAGIFVYVKSGYKPPPVGSKVELTADVKEYYGLTELANISSTTTLSSNNKIEPVSIDPKVLSGGCNFDGEKYEGMLVSIDNLTVTGDKNDNNQFSVSDSLGNEIIVDQYLYEGDWPDLKKGAVLKNIIGIAHYGFNEYKIMPLNKHDIMISDSMIVSPKSTEFLIYPNPSQSIVNFKLNLDSHNQILDKIEIINASGYIIANLSVNSQVQKFTWNGKTINEKLAPSGVYFVRFKWESSYKTQKFVLLR